MTASKHIYERHGACDTRLYRIWGSMLQRCTTPTCNHFSYYGGRGISVCAEWLNSFIAFRRWAESSGYSATLTLDRIDNDGNYEPKNCRWATRKQQSNNSRRVKPIAHGAEKMNVREWAKSLGIAPSTLYSRLWRGASADRALVHGRMKRISKET